MNSNRNRNRSIRVVMTAVLIFIAALPLAAQSMNISQIDLSDLLSKGELRAYLSLPEGSDPKIGDISAVDSETGSMEVLSIEKGVNADDGIRFLFLLDGSGSMFQEKYNGRPRIDEARDALSEFIDLTSGGPDTSGVMLFNTYLKELAPMGADPRTVNEKLHALEEPEAKSAYTELYNSIYHSLAKLSGRPGRRALILLSDGEDLHYADYEGGDSPAFGQERRLPEEVVEALRRAGVTLYGINFADGRDPSLSYMAEASGGAVYEARSAAELAAVYESIRRDILGEYMLRLKAPAYTSSERELTVSYGDVSASASYYVPLLFGGPSSGENPWLLPLILLLLALGTSVLLYIIPFEGAASSAQVQSLDSNTTVVLKSEVTKIGSSTSADMTIGGNPGIEGEHATILRGEDGEYTLVARGKLRVNNNPVERTRLRPGDVIRMEGSTVIFDAPGSDATVIDSRGDKKKRKG